MFYNQKLDQSNQLKQLFGQRNRSYVIEPLINIYISRIANY